VKSSAKNYRLEHL